MLFSNIKVDDKERYRDFLRYIDTVLNDSLEANANGVNFVNLHIPSSDESLKEILLQLISIKFFFLGLKNHTISEDKDKGFITDITNSVNEICSLPIKLAYDGPGVDKRGKKREIDIKLDYKEKLRAIRYFYQSLRPYDLSNITLYKPRTLINMPKKHEDYLIDEFNERKFAIPFDKISFKSNIERWEIMNASFVVTNSHHNRNELDELDYNNKLDAFDEIENVILFNCDSQSIHSQFNHTALTQLNENEGTNFKNLIVLSFDYEQFKMNRLISRLDRLCTKFYYRPKGLNYKSYVILPYELDYLIQGNVPTPVEIEIIETQHLLCTTFQEHINDHEELYEFYSIKMRNIYSLCIDDKCKRLIIEDLFSHDIENPQLISQRSKDVFLNLDDESQKRLRSTLEAILDIVIDKNLPAIILEKSRGEPARIVIPDIIQNHNILFDRIGSMINSTSEHSIINWDKALESSNQNIIILDYRDSGPYPYQIFPNIFEISFHGIKQVHAIFFGMFFGYNYQRTYYDYNQSLLMKVMNHPYRDKFFSWKKLTQSLLNNKPSYNSMDYLWDLDNAYGSNWESESIVIEYDIGSKKSYNPSQLFIAALYGDEHLTTIRADDLLKEHDNTRYSVQQIESIYQGLNLFESTHEEVAEIEELRRLYGLEGEDIEHRLWKMLLIQKADTEGVETIYSEITERVSKFGEKIVQRGYFNKYWLEIESDLLIPRSKRVFSVLCDYLILPRSYFRVMLKKRSRDKLNTRIGNLKMNRLIADLIHEGMFDTSEDLSTILNPIRFAEDHDLEEIGITPENIESELKALVDLLKPKLSLIEVKNVELN